MNNNTTITYEKVKQNASTIRNCSTKMSTIFDEVASTMEALNKKEALIGEAGDALLLKFNSLKANFDSFTDMVRKFAAWIDNAEEQTERTEKEIASITDELV